MDIIVNSQREAWEKTNYFCPACGAQAIAREAGPGELYVGEDHLCLKCASKFKLGAAPQDRHDPQRIDALRRLR